MTTKTKTPSPLSAGERAELKGFLGKLRVLEKARNDASYDSVKARARELLDRIQADDGTDAGRLEKLGASDLLPD